MADLRSMPEFKALQTAYAALLPLKPEGRRKVIEAIHSLLEISAGTQQEQPRRGAAKRR